LKAPQMMIEDVTITHESCSGSKDGSIELEISGGTPNYVVNWGVGVGVGNPIGNLSGGMYTATITDNNGCKITSPTLTVNSSSLNPAIAKTDVTCFGSGNGTITITLPPTGGPYTVTWDPTSAGSGPNLINLGPGAYTPTIVDGSGCITELEPIFIFQPDDITLDGKTTPVLCAGQAQGSINLTATGGNGTFTYKWSNNAVTEDLINVVSGNYSVTVTDGNNCTKTGSYTITGPSNPLTVTAVTTPTTINQSTGTITLTVTGGNPNYTYLWSNNAVTKDLTALSAGSYTVTVTDSNGCTKTLTTTVSNADDNVVTFDRVDYNGFNISCYGQCDGTAVAFAPGSAAQPVTFTLAEGRDCPAVSLYLDITPGLAIVGEESRVELVPIVANLRHHDIEPVFNDDTVHNGGPDFQWKRELTLLWDLATVLEAGRGKAAGNEDRIDFGFSVDWTEETADGPGRVSIGRRLRGSPMDKLVAELMIYANMTWGKLLDTSGIPGLYRAQGGGKVRMTTVAAPHEGLGVDCYAWSSSPLRRYVDLVNQWQIVSVLQGTDPAFAPKSAELMAAMRDFELTYAEYAEFQRGMERYWCLRWLRQHGRGEVEATVLRESVVRLTEIPLVFRVPSMPLQMPGSRVKLFVERTDLLDVEVEARFVQTLAEPDPATVDETGFGFA
ncbi:MAG TPA: RNB domain-containing ribonuclease, partial [Thauera sp.]|uniref:RNB domain-containing ribonuclease n=1 Tax=Thauera sp. TaxID=1905334 RepID=UPI002B540625